jgi:hypothetical protein
LLREQIIHAIVEHCVVLYRDASLIKKRPPPQDTPRTLGIGLR